MIRNEEEKENSRWYKLDLNDDEHEDWETVNLTGLWFVYPFGTTLNLGSKAIPLLNSGTVCYPVSASLLAYALHGKGKMFVCGSWKMFED